MSKLKSYFTATILGGVVFLVPMVGLILILAKAFSIIHVVSVPMASVMPFQSVAGIALADILGIIALLVLTLIAGVLARSFVGQRVYGWIDGLLSRAVPGYTYFKSIAGSLAEAEGESLLPVLVYFDDQAQIGFEVERTKSGMVTVFLPGSPDTRSGTLSIVEPRRVAPLDAKFHETIRSLAHFGRGSARLLDDTDLRPPAAAAPPPNA